MPQTTSRTSWDPASLLNIHSTHPQWFNCVGTTLKGERCKCQVARANVDIGMSLLDRLPQRFIASEELQNKLEYIAARLLCRRNHQYQATRVANKWKNIIIAEQSRHSRLEAPRRSRRVQDVDGDIFMSREARARERRLDEQRMEQLQSGGCPICYHEFESPCETACTHTFCYECVAPWVRRHGNCPSCRAQARVRELLMVELVPERPLLGRAQQTASEPAASTRQGPSVVGGVVLVSNDPSREEVERMSRLPDPQAAAVQAPASRTSGPQTPALRAAAPRTPVPRTLALQTPAATPVTFPRLASPAPGPLAARTRRETAEQGREARLQEHQTWARRIEKLDQGCPICLEEMEVPCETTCKHITCHDCMDRWLDISRTCPLCRGGVTKQSLVLI